MNKTLIKLFSIAVAVTAFSGCGLVKTGEWDASREPRRLTAYGQTWIDQEIVIKQKYFVIQGDGFAYKTLQRFLIDESGRRIDMQTAFWALQQNGSYKQIVQEPIDVIGTRIINRNNRLYVIIGDSTRDKKMTDCFAYRGDPNLIKVYNMVYYGWGELDPVTGRFLIDRFIPLNANVTLRGTDHSREELDEIERSRTLPLYCNQPVDMVQVERDYNRLVEEIKRIPAKNMKK